MGVNKQGARVATFHALPAGSQLAIVNPVAARTAKAQVVWVGEKRFPEDPHEMGLELLEPGNIWDIRFPPEDWEDEALLGGVARVQEKPAGTAPSQAPPTPITHQAAQFPENSEAGGAPAAVPRAGPQPEAGELGSEALESALEGITRRVDSQVQASLHEVTNRLNELQEARQTFESLEQRLNSLAERLQASSDWAEALVSKAQETNRQGLDTAARELRDKLRNEAENASSQLLEHARERIQHEVSGWFEALSQEASTRLARLTEEYVSQAASQLKARQRETHEEAGAQLSMVVQAAATELTEKLRRMADEMKAALRREIEKSLETSAGQIAERLTPSFVEQVQTASRNAEQSFQEKLKKIREQIQEEISTAGLKARQTCEQESEAIEKKIADRVETFDLATEEAVTKLRAAYRTIESEFKAVGEKVWASLQALVDENERAETRIKTLTEQVVKEASDTLFKQVGFGGVAIKDWGDQARTRLEVFLQEALESFRKQIGELSQGTLESHRQDAEALGSELRNRLDRAAYILQRSEQAGAKTQAAPGRAVEPLSPESAEQPLGHSDLGAEAPKSSREETLDEDTKAFRKKIAEALAKFQIGGKQAGESGS